MSHSLIHTLMAEATMQDADLLFGSNSGLQFLGQVSWQPVK